jgi:8-oxo-dGTP diphosphatase
VVSRAECHNTYQIMPLGSSSSTSTQTSSSNNPHQEIPLISSTSTQTSPHTNNSQTQTNTIPQNSVATSTHCTDEKQQLKTASDSPLPRPAVGVAVLITCTAAYPGCVLIGKRISSHGANSYQLPGGHLEHGESWSECASRELLEETNIDITKHHTSMSHTASSNDIFTIEKKHYITLFMQCDVSAQQAAQLKVMEPLKCSGWFWKPWTEIQANQLDAPLFLPLANLSQNGFDPFK